MTKEALGILFVFVFFFISCKQDKEEKQSYELEGKWEIFEAYRNNEITNTLEDAYFNFKDSMMETNILGSPLRGSYELSGNIFKHNSTLPVEYLISNYSSDSMEIDTEIRSYNFTFKLAKLRDTIPAN